MAQKRAKIRHGHMDKYTPVLLPLSPNWGQSLTPLWIPRPWRERENEPHSTGLFLHEGFADLRLLEIGGVTQGPEWG